MQSRSRRRPAVHVSWGSGNVLHICSIGSGIEQRNDSEVLSVSWADTSADQRALAATLSPLYAKLQSTDGPEALEEVRFSGDRQRKEKLDLWSSEVSDALSPATISTTSRVSTQSVGLVSSSPFATLGVIPKPSASTSPLSHLFNEPSSGDLSANQSRFAHLAAMSAVWDLLSICFLHSSAGTSTTANSTPLMAASAAGQASSCMPLVTWVARHNEALPPVTDTLAHKLGGLQRQLQAAEIIRPEDLEDYWHCTLLCVAVGWRDTAISLLRLHSSYREDQVLQREEENGLVETVVILISEMALPPAAANMADMADITNYQAALDKWRNRIGRLSASDYWSSCTHLRTQRNLLTILDILLGRGAVIAETAGFHWLELLAAQLLHLHPLSGPSTWSRIALSCWEKHHRSHGASPASLPTLTRSASGSDNGRGSPMDRLLLAVLQREPEVVVALASRIFPSWFLLHVVELLSLDLPLLSRIPASRAAARGIRLEARHGSLGSEGGRAQAGGGRAGVGGPFSGSTSSVAAASGGTRLHASHQMALTLRSSPGGVSSNDMDEEEGMTSTWSVVDVCRLNWAADMLAHSATWQCALPLIASCQGGESIIQEVSHHRPASRISANGVLKNLYHANQWAPDTCPVVASLAYRSLAMSFWEARSISPAFQVAAFHWLLESGDRTAGAPITAASKWLAVTMLKAFVADASDDELSQLGSTVEQLQFLHAANPSPALEPVQQCWQALLSLFQDEPRLSGADTVEMLRWVARDEPLLQQHLHGALTRCMDRHPSWLSAADVALLISHGQYSATSSQLSHIDPLFTASSALEFRVAIGRQLAARIMF